MRQATQICLCGQNDAALSLDLISQWHTLVQHGRALKAVLKSQL